MTQKYGRDSNAYCPWRLDSEPCLNRSPKVQFSNITTKITLVAGRQTCIERIDWPLRLRVLLEFSSCVHRFVLRNLSSPEFPSPEFLRVCGLIVLLLLLVLWNLSKVHDRLEEAGLGLDKPPPPSGIQNKIEQQGGNNQAIATRNP